MTSTIKQNCPKRARKSIKGARGQDTTPTLGVGRIGLIIVGNDKNYAGAAAVDAVSKSTLQASKACH